MPIATLPSPTARLYALFHPIFLLALGAASFTHLVDRTKDVLLTSLLALAVLQSTYVVTSLPPAGTTPSSSASGSGSSTPTTGGVEASIRDRRRQAQLPPSKKISTSILALIIPFLLGTPILYVIAILFGAPLTTHSTETCLLAAHMSILAGTPLVYVHGMEGRVWLDVASLNRPWDSVWGGSLGVLVGAWFGAVPIPLDWDRPWQAYPITILGGAYMGYAAFSLLGRCPGVYGKRLRFDDDTEEVAEHDNKKNA